MTTYKETNQMSLKWEFVTTTDLCLENLDKIQPQSYNNIVLYIVTPLWICKTQISWGHTNSDKNDLVVQNMVALNSSQCSVHLVVTTTLMNVKHKLQCFLSWIRTSLFKRHFCCPCQDQWREEFRAKGCCECSCYPTGWLYMVHVHAYNNWCCCSFTFGGSSKVPEGLSGEVQFASSINQTLSSVRQDVIRTLQNPNVKI